MSLLINSILTRLRNSPNLIDHKEVNLLQSEIETLRFRLGILHDQNSKLRGVLFLMQIIANAHGRKDLVDIATSVLEECK